MSHQSRREPLPADYQFGDACPSVKRDVEVTEATFLAMEMMWASISQIIPTDVLREYKKDWGGPAVLAIGDQRFIMVKGSRAKAQS